MEKSSIQDKINFLKQLYNLRHKENRTWAEISRLLNKSIESLYHTYKRIQWEEFFKDPEAFLAKKGEQQKWSDEEMIRLHTLLCAGKSYSFIAEQLGRTVLSVEGRAKRTDWKAWEALRKITTSINNKDDKEQEKNKEEENEQVVEALLRICRYDFAKVKQIKEKEFLDRVNLDKSRLNIPFSKIQKRSIDKLVELGFGNPENMQLGKGTYIIVGDSHGKHTKKAMFAMLKKCNEYLKPQKIIHIGHILDDDNDISYDWGQFPNLVILAKVEELKIIQEQRNKFNFHYEIVRESIAIGKDLFIFNQDLISDYVKTSISTIDSEIFDDKAIVNSHRFEFYTRCSSDVASYFASPGCLCEPHIIKTIKQIDWDDGKITKQAFWDGFSKYRRMRHTNKYWEQGMLVIDVNDQGEHTICPCPIKKFHNGFATSYFDKIISSEKIINPQVKIFINGDIHSDNHDCKVLDIQEQICKDYKADIFVSIGDTHNYYALNHHIMDRGGVIFNKKILQEAAQTNYILKKMESWAPKKYIICGNHERFARDFVEKFPQFSEYLDFKFLCGAQDLKYEVINLKDVLKLGSAKFVHGEMKMYGQNGNKLEKAAKTFGSDVFIGHIHSPCIRLGCYSVGLTGDLNQEYNEVNASNWLHGFGLCNQYEGKSWMTTIAIVNSKCILNKKTYIPKKPDLWKMKSYKAHISFEV